ncbi:transposable element Tc3 transposase [Trichonephila clavipes]|nr:transposable element Tc3 transposase [Trichonephila clavipes]
MDSLEGFMVCQLPPALLQTLIESIPRRVASPACSLGPYTILGRFSLPSDSHRNLIWRAPGTRYHQENTIERHRYGGAGWLVWGGIILGFQN